MPRIKKFVVRATLGRGENRRRVTSMRFNKRVLAQRFADSTNKDRPGSNARVTELC